MNVDLNADVGESFGAWHLGDDAALLQIVTSANVACGFHAGDPATLRETVALAVEHGVVVGAQVAYPDLVGFGRRPMDVSPRDLEADVLYQLGALDGLCRASGSRVRYVKPHGALYHRVLDDAEQAAAVVRAVALYDPTLPILTMAGGALERIASDHDVRAIVEGYADRAYRDGRLVPRTQPGAVLDDLDAVAAQAVELARGAQVASICLHGDTPGAVEMAAAVRRSLAAAGIEVRAFA